jgi:hypothetical protein
MPELLVLDTFTDVRGNLSVLEDRQIPFKIKRLFYIYGVDKSKRAAHRHKITYQALICITGSCRVHVDNGKEKSSYVLDEPKKCLVLDPQDWHIVDDFKPGAILLVCASEYFDENDYIYEAYS